MGRAAGILMAVSSLPGKYGIGSFDQEAYRFVDFLERAGQTYWQILPLNPPNHHPLAYDSPYQSFSTFAGNPYYISLDALIQEGVLSREEVEAVDFGNDPVKVDYEKLYTRRLPLLRKAYERSRIAEREDYQKFIRENAWWLDDYALFMALKAFFQEAEWPDWPEDISRHWGYAIDYYNQLLYFDIEFHKYTQFKFFQQWNALKAYANAKHIRIIGEGVSQNVEDALCGLFTGIEHFCDNIMLVFVRVKVKARNNKNFSLFLFSHGYLLQDDFNDIVTGIIVMMRHDDGIGLCHRRTDFGLVFEVTLGFWQMHFDVFLNITVIVNFKIITEGFDNVIDSGFVGIIRIIYTCFCLCRGMFDNEKHRFVLLFCHGLNISCCCF